MENKLEKNLEKNFISAVVYLQNAKDRAVPFFEKLNQQLQTHFEKYEMIAVNDHCTDGTMEKLKEWAALQDNVSLTVINLSLQQGVEAAMNAGLDAAIGDYVLEFDSMELPMETGLLWQAYQKALQGFDVVSVCPSKAKLSSKIFYHVFNRYSKSAYKLQTDVFRLVSRRAINRVHAMNNGLVYRKASYAASGLPCASIQFKGKASVQDEHRADKAFNSLLLYTDVGYKVTLGISLVMLLLTLIAVIYTIVVFCTGSPIQGWTTTMLVLSVGLSGLFMILTVVVKYLNILVRLNFKKQMYLIDGMERLHQ